MLAKPSWNLLQRTGGDHRGGHAQPGWRTFVMTCLRLGYMRLEIWHKIGLSVDRCLCTWRWIKLLNISLKRRLCHLLCSRRAQGSKPISDINVDRASAYDGNYLHRMIADYRACMQQVGLRRIRLIQPGDDPSFVSCWHRHLLEHRGLMDEMTDANSFNAFSGNGEYLPELNYYVRLFHIGRIRFLEAASQKLR